jgi:hypothetical protein
MLHVQVIDVKHLIASRCVLNGTGYERPLLYARQCKHLDAKAWASAKIFGHVIDGRWTASTDLDRIPWRFKMSAALFMGSHELESYSFPVGARTAHNTHYSTTAQKLTDKHIRKHTQVQTHLNRQHAEPHRGTHKYTHEHVQTRGGLHVREYCAGMLAGALHAPVPFVRGVMYVYTRIYVLASIE